MKNLTVAQLANKFPPFMGPVRPLQRTEETGAGPSPEKDKTIPILPPGLTDGSFLRGFTKNRAYISFLDHVFYTPRQSHSRFNPIIG